MLFITTILTVKSQKYKSAFDDSGGPDFACTTNVPKNLFIKDMFASLHVFLDRVFGFDDWVYIPICSAIEWLV